MMPPSTRYQYYLWRSDISVVFVYRECSWQNSYRLTYSNHQQVFAPRFGDVPRRWTNTCPMFLQGINLWTSTCPVFWKGHSSVDECLPHVLERVFVHGTNTCSMCWRGYSSMGRMLAPCVGEGIRPWDEYLPRERTRSRRIRIPIRIRIRAGCVKFVASMHRICVAYKVLDRRPHFLSPAGCSHMTL